MTVPPACSVELLLDGSVTEDDERDAITLFSLLGGVGRVRRQPAHRGADGLAWLMLASLPLQGFLTGLGGRVADDAFAGLQKLAARLHLRSDRQADRVVPLILADVHSGLRIALDADLPIEAYQQLRELDLTKYRIGPLHYDRAGGRWRSELDEAVS